METQSLVLVMVFSLVISTAYCDSYRCNCSTNLTRQNFPTGFVFGASSSAYQFEGAYNQDGKGPSIWDHYTHKYPGKIADLRNGDEAVDSYHRYKDDIECAKNMNLDVYRFSIAWTRILPNASLRGGQTNQKGIDYYNNLINELIEQGLTPYVTLFHWDLPQVLDDAYGGFLNNRVVEDFNTYANVCFANFGDRVKHWITFNEPWSFSNLGYAEGTLAPFRCSQWQRSGCLGGDSGTEPYWVTHHQLLAHAKAVQTYKKYWQPTQKGSIGITLVTSYAEPYSNTSDDIEAQQRALDFSLGWFLHPITYGDYPQRMKYIVGNRLPVFKPEETALLKGSFDFLGLNYYSTSFVQNLPNSYGAHPSYTTDAQTTNSAYNEHGDPIGKEKCGWIFIHPKGILNLLVWIKNNYGDLNIVITENGLCEDNIELSPEEEKNDTDRIKYIHDHLCCVKEAITKHQINVTGYIVWSLLDNFEWASGYIPRFGLYYVDYKDNLNRTPKKSAHWLANILEKNTVKKQTLSSRKIFDH